MRCGIARPGYESWVGVSRDVLRYVRALEIEIDNFGARQESLGIEHREEIASLRKALVRKQREVRSLSDQLKLAHERLGLSSQNSSKPPSSDGHSRPKRPVRTPGGRRRGGQPRHRFHARPLVAPGECATITDHRVRFCRDCGELLIGDDPAPLRHQIVELPRPLPRVEEHRLHSLRCGNCGTTNRATLPDEVKGRGFGPGVEATVATLAGSGRLSHRTIKDIMRDLFGVRMALGTVPTLLARAGEAVAPAVAEARDFVRWHEGVKNVDETTWYQRGADGSNESARQAYIWVVATEPATVYEIALSRAQRIAKGLIGEPVLGTLVTDRYSGYKYVDLDQRQLCWAHLYRDFVRISERSGRPGQIGRQLAKVTERLFRIWDEYRNGDVEQSVWESVTQGVKMRIHGLLDEGSRLAVRPDERSERSRTRNTCRELLSVERAMWTFLARPGIGMTNNLAERSLRHAVLWRRVSFGSQSESGAETVARLLTVVMTTRRRGESAHEFLVEACRAAHEGRAGPSLIAGNTTATTR